MSPARETTGRPADARGAAVHAPESRRSRLYRDGRLVRQDVAASEVRALLADPAAVVWVDRDAADAADLALLTDQLDLSRLALDDTLDVGQRPKVNRHGHHLLLTLYGARVDRTSGELTTSELGVLADRLHAQRGGVQHAGATALEGGDLVLGAAVRGHADHPAGQGQVLSSHGR